MVLVAWPADSIDLSFVPFLKTAFQMVQLPIMEEVIGSDAGS